MQTESLLSTILPFSIIVDSKMCIRDWGRSFEKLCGGACSDHTSMWKWLKPDRDTDQTSSLSIDELLKATRLVHSKSRLLMNTVACEIDDDRILVALSPFLQDVNKIQRAGLSYTDFSRLYPIFDFLMLQATAQASAAEANQKIETVSEHNHYLKIISGISSDISTTEDTAGEISRVLRVVAKEDRWDLALLIAKESDGNRTTKILGECEHDPDTVSYLSAVIINNSENCAAGKFVIHHEGSAAIVLGKLVSQSDRATEYLYGLVKFSPNVSITDRQRVFLSEVSWYLESRTASLDKRHIELTRQALVIEKMRSESVRKLAKTITHEINSPLAALTGRLDLLLDQLSELNDGDVNLNTIKEGISSAARIAGRISAIVQSVQKVGKQGNQEPMSLCSVSQLIRESLEITSHAQSTPRATLHIDIDEGLAINCRPTAFIQIAVNLIRNAIEALETVSSPMVSITSCRVNDGQHRTVEIRFEDNGHQISHEVEQKLFTPTFSTKLHKNGMGIGLATSRGLAENQGATLSYSRQNDRTRFTLAYPEIDR